MIQKGDCVIFIIGKNSNVYQTTSDTYIADGRLVVDIYGISEEVDVSLLAKIESLFKEDF